MDFLMGAMSFGLDALAILLLLATWQHTRIHGFLVLASSYALGILSRGLLPLLTRFMDSDGSGAIQNLGLIYQGSYLLITVVGLYGLWDIYQNLKRRPTETTSSPT
jgi:hypothetical protein